MVSEEHTTPDKMTLKHLVGMLTAGQARAIVIGAVGMIGAVFAAGMWVNELRIVHSYQSKLELMITQEQHEKDVIALTGQHNKRIQSLTEEHAAELSDANAKNDKLIAQVKTYTLQIEFLERCHAYLYARIKGREDSLNNDSDDAVNGSRKQFAITLRRMYKEGDRSIQKKDGYEFDESDASDHKVIFGSVKPYRIPSDVKGNFIDSL